MTARVSSASRSTPPASRGALETRYVDERADDLDEALERVDGWRTERAGRSIGLFGNAADVYPELVRRGIAPGLVTDQTSAHDPLIGYVPKGITSSEAARAPRARPRGYIAQAKAIMAEQSRRCSTSSAPGRHVFDYGNNIRAQARGAGVENAFDFPGFVPAYIRPLFCEGKGPSAGSALSGDPEDIARTDERCARAFPDDAVAAALDPAGRRERVPFQGLPARICWLGYGERAKAGLALQRARRTGEVRRRSSSAATTSTAARSPRPYRETEAMRDGSDAIADWPILNALVNTAAGATWVSFHHGGGVGIGYSLHAGHGRRRRRHPRGRAPPRARAHDATPAWASSATPTRATSGRLEVADERGVRIPMRPDA